MQNAFIYLLMLNPEPGGAQSSSGKMAATGSWADWDNVRGVSFQRGSSSPWGAQCRWHQWGFLALLPTFEQTQYRGHLCCPGQEGFMVAEAAATSTTSWAWSSPPPLSSIPLPASPCPKSPYCSRCCWNTGWPPAQHWGPGLTSIDPALLLLPCVESRTWFMACLQCF